MSEESDLEKTEPASARKLEQAREEGNVPRSRELGTAMVMAVAVAGMWVFGSSMVSALMQMTRQGLSLTRDQVFDFDLLLAAMVEQLMVLLPDFLPLALMILLASVAGPALMGGFIVSSKQVMPDFKRMNPLSGLGRMVSTHALIELGKAVAKSVLVGLVSWFLIADKFESMMAMVLEPPQSAAAHLGQLLLLALAWLVAALVVIAAIDAPVQLWQYGQNLMMSKEDLKQEYKETEGNPEIKGKIRQQQREMAKRRMMAEIPNADVVVTNPTHYAVALKYADGKGGAPRVVAKGADELAAKIREIAGENAVPLLEAPPLARALYRHVELGDAIPQTLYATVAQVLAYVYQLRAHRKHGGVLPEAPTELEVPEGLDPLERVIKKTERPVQ